MHHRNPQRDHMSFDVPPQFHVANEPDIQCTGHTTAMTMKIAAITGHVFGVEFIRGFAEAAKELGSHLDLVKLFALHPSRATSTVGYADAIHSCGKYFSNASYFDSAKNAEIARDLSSEGPTFIICVGLSQLIPAELVAKYTKREKFGGHWKYYSGLVGAHPTALPNGRGRAPIPWTILNGLSQGALSTFFIADGADNGPIILQDQWSISKSITATQLFDRAAKAHARHGRRVAQLIISPSGVLSTPQNEQFASEWPQRKAADSHISCMLSVAEVLKMVRALQRPYPLPFVVLDTQVLRVVSAHAVENDLPKGKIVHLTDKSLLLGLRDGVVRLRTKNLVDRWTGELELP